MTASSATSGSPYGVMASAADFVAPRPLAVTVGNYLLMYADGRFARHPRFRYFALNTEMRWRALQAGRIYVRQHPHDAQLFFLDCVNMVAIHQYYHCSSITSTETQRVYRHVRSGSPPPMPCIRLVYYIPAMYQWLYMNCFIPEQMLVRSCILH